MSAESDYKFLSLANDKLKFGIEMGLTMEPDTRDSFERGIDNDWFTLVDLSAGVAAAPYRVLKIFKLTDAGIRRLYALRGQLKDQIS